MVEPREKRKTSKSETLTIRLDPKTRFMLEFMARRRGQTITTVVERAITDAAGRERIRKAENFYEDWKDFWNVIEGIRSLRIAQEPELFPTYEEERRLQFSTTHWPFFYHSSDCEQFVTHYIEVLWPRIDEWIDIFDETKALNYFEAGQRMQEALRGASLRAPDWPVKTFDESIRGGPDDNEAPF
ncbi:hypothetical protein [Xanthobacter autotrophicus]|uniref:hypothetical protein n=1 Tax=Xanthobacter autotrophicus TaxID=280 RepID=UPI00372C54F4